MAVAAVVAAAAAFAFADLAPLLGAVNAERLAPAQDVLRAAAAAGKMGASAATDGAVELALDAYEAAGTGAEKLGELFQDVFGKVTDGASGAAKAAKPAMSKAAAAAQAAANDTPLSTLGVQAREAFAFVVDAVRQGDWAKILYVKPFKGLAAVGLTIVRISISWILSGIELGFALLYSTPAYVAVGGILLAVLLKRISSGATDAPSQGKTVETGLIAAPTPPARAPITEPVTAITAVTEKASEAAAETKADAKVETAKESEGSLPASAVMQASSRKMTEEETSVLMGRVQEAKAQMDAVEASKAGSSPPKVSAPARSPATSSPSSASSPSTVDQAEVDRIYEELTSKYYNLNASSSSSSSSLPGSLPSSSGTSSKFDPEEFLAAFSQGSTVEPPASASPPPSASTPPVPKPSPAASKAPPTPTPKPPAAAAATSKAPPKPSSPSTPKPKPSMPVTAAGTTASKTPIVPATAIFDRAKKTEKTEKTEKAASASVNSASMNVAKFVKVAGDMGKLAVTTADIGLKIGGKAIETGATKVRDSVSKSSAVKKTLQETLELAEVVVPAVPSLVRKAVQERGIGGKDVKDKVTPEVASEQKSAELTEGREVRTEATLDEVSSGTVIKKKKAAEDNKK